MGGANGGYGANKYSRVDYAGGQHHAQQTAGAQYYPSQQGGAMNESYLVKKYRPEKPYRSIEAFARYTKVHRMLDATYVRVPYGGTGEKPYVFATRINHSDLSWGRGKTRDSAIDAAIRAAFYLVQAHGYTDFPMDDDCLTQEPTPAAMMPPPPLPPGIPPSLPAERGMGVPSPGMSLPSSLYGFTPPSGQPPTSSFTAPQGLGLPITHGLVQAPLSSNFPPPPSALGLAAPPPTAANIPPPRNVCETAPEATRLSANKSGSIGVNVIANPAMSVSDVTSAIAPLPNRTPKDGSKIVYDPSPLTPDEDDFEMSMEEKRAKQSRYQRMLRDVM